MFQVNFPKNMRLKHLCFEYYDFIANIYENKILEQTIVFKNCSDVDVELLLYNQNNKVKTVCEKDLLNKDDMIYLRLDAISTSINSYELEFEKKIAISQESNIKYN